VQKDGAGASASPCDFDSLTVRILLTLDIGFNISTIIIMDYKHYCAAFMTVAAKILDVPLMCVPSSVKVCVTEAPLDCATPTAEENVTEYGPDPETAVGAYWLVELVIGTMFAVPAAIMSDIP